MNEASITDDFSQVNNRGVHHRPPLSEMHESDKGSEQVQQKTEGSTRMNLQKIAEFPSISSNLLSAEISFITFPQSEKYDDEVDKVKGQKLVVVYDLNKYMGFNAALCNQN